MTFRFFSCPFFLWLYFYPGVIAANDKPGCNLVEALNAIERKRTTAHTFQAGDTIVITSRGARFEGQFTRILTNEDGISVGIEMTEGTSTFKFKFHEFDHVFKYRPNVDSKVKAFAIKKISHSADGELIVLLSDGATLSRHDGYFKMTTADGRVLEATHRREFVYFKDKGKVAYRVQLETGAPVRIENLELRKAIDIQTALKATTKVDPNVKEILKSIDIKGQSISTGYFAAVVKDGKTEWVIVTEVYSKGGKKYLTVEDWVKGKKSGKPYRVEMHEFIGTARHDVLSSVKIRGGKVTTTGVDQFVSMEVRLHPEYYATYEYKLTRIWIDDKGVRRFEGQRIKRNTVTGRAEVAKEVEELKKLTKLSNSQTYYNATVKDGLLPGPLHKAFFGELEISAANKSRYVEVNSRPAEVLSIYVDDAGELKAKVRLIGQHVDGRVEHLEIIEISAAKTKVKYSERAERMATEFAEAEKRGARQRHYDPDDARYTEGPRYKGDPGQYRPRPRRRGGMTEAEARKILGVKKGDSKRKVQIAKRKLARKHHPDLGSSKNPAQKKARENKLKKINAAWDVLYPPPKQEQYK